jgi:hypothetical protein
MVRLFGYSVNKQTKVIVIELASSAVDGLFIPRSVQTKDYKIGKTDKE